MPLTRDTTADAEALDQMSEWLCHPDPDGQWRSAADFIELAADLLKRTGRATTPARVPDPPRFVVEPVSLYGDRISETATTRPVAFAVYDTLGPEPPRIVSVFLSQEAADRFTDAMNENTDPLR